MPEDREVQLGADTELIHRPVNQTRGDAPMRAIANDVTVGEGTDLGSPVAIPALVSLPHGVHPRLVRHGGCTIDANREPQALARLNGPGA